MPNKCYVAYGLVHPSKNLWTTPPDSSLQLWSVTTINRNCTVDRRLPAKAILDKTYSLLAAKAAQGPQFVLSSDKHFAHCFLNRHAEATFVAFRCPNCTLYTIMPKNAERITLIILCCSLGVMHCGDRLALMRVRRCLPNIYRNRAKMYFKVRQA